jgi:glycosyltransferase involved in cell wall biosynthesis
MESAFAAIQSRAFDTQRHVDVSIVLACYNEGPVLAANVATIVDVLDQCRWAYELLFIDDCSSDGTPALLRDLVAAYPDHQIRAEFHARNHGRGATVVEGMRAGRGAIVGFLDVDLEVHARYLPSCIRAVEQGADVATAQRTYKFRWHSLDRYILSRGYILLVRHLLDVSLADTETGFKFFRKDRILPVFDQTEDHHWFWDTEVMVRASLRGLRIEEIPVLFLRRADKQSTVRPVADTLNYFRRLWRFRGTLAALRRGDPGASATRDRIR